MNPCRKHLPPKFGILAFLLVFSLLQGTGYSAGDDLALEEIAKTAAARLFVSKKYQESLFAFQQLEQEHPGNLIIKRYIASLYDTLRQWDRAVQKLQEVIRLNNDDLKARMMLGDIFVKQAKFSSAKQEFNAVIRLTPDDNVREKAKNKREEIDNLEAAGMSVQGKRMAVQDFMKSNAAQSFAVGKYQEALQGFAQLLESYPEDLLVRRFRGLALLKLKQTDLAVKAFQETIAMAPDNVALHFYLGEAYREKKMVEEARDEYRWVLATEDENYKIRSQQAIFKTLGKGQKRKRKLWSISGSVGYEYDNNATFTSNDITIRTSGTDTNAGKYPFLITGNYRFYEYRKWSFTADVLYAQTLLDEIQRLQTYTPGGGISGLYGFKLFNRPAFLNIREGITYTLLRRKFFVASNSFSTSLIYLLSKKQRTTFNYRFGYSEYDGKGSEPSLNNRDGFAHAYSVSATYYLNERRTFYFTSGYDFETHDTQGKNFNKYVNGARLGVHFPIFEKVEGDISFRFKDSNYYTFGSTPPQRRDDQFSLTTILSRPLNDHLNLSSYYTFEDTKAKNNIYETTRQLFGFKLAFRY